MPLQINEWPEFSGLASAMTIGVFDGVHLGHQALIERIVRRGPNPTVISFRENPKKSISPGSFEGDVFNLEQKLAAFDSLGVRHLILIDFSENFCKMDGREFFEILAEKGGMVYLAIGEDFRCGFRKETDAESIKLMNEERGIPTEIVSSVSLPDEFGGGPVSSSRLRSAILSGDIELAQAMMGRSFIFLERQPTGV